MLKGITWDDPRGYRPMEAFSQLAGPDVPTVEWHRQPLADFESRSIDELAQTYDLLVIDHPGIAQAVAAGALMPLSELFDPGELLAWEADCVGSTWRSYRYSGHQWALPIDAATQTAVSRPDRVERLPKRWGDVTAFASEHPTALCLGGPQALLMLIAMSVGPDDDGLALLHPERGRDSLELLQRIWRVVDQETSLLDPIGVHDALATDSELCYCPLAYGYARYARPADGAFPLAWSEPPSNLANRHGSVLGGTGLAFSARSASRDSMRGFARAFLRDEVQVDTVPAAGGQPAHIAAWRSADLDAAWGGFYSGTRRAVENAWIRPRVPGWIPFQSAGSAIVCDAVIRATPPAQVITAINDMYATIVQDAASGG